MCVSLSEKLARALRSVGGAPHLAQHTGLTASAASWVGVSRTQAENGANPRIVSPSGHCHVILVVAWALDPAVHEPPLLLGEIVEGCIQDSYGEGDGWVRVQELTAVCSSRVQRQLS